MTTLVTGSAGHLGEALMRTLRVAGRPVVGLDRVASPFTDVVGSITDPAVVARCVEGASAVVHTATLHKPHIVSHTRQEFVDVNITGTLTLLEAAARAGVRAFLYTSTTSTFGAALEHAPDAPAAWIDEAVVPIPKNIYGVTKVAAEDLCVLAHRNQGLPCLVLRTSRFFPEPDDDPAARDAYPDANLKLNELLYRRVDIEDVVDAHLCALDRAATIGFARYIITATTPLRREDIDELRRDAPAVLRRRVPGWDEVYAKLGYRMPQAITRVYDNSRARAELGWRPRHDFASAIARIAAGGELRSELAKTIGIKGYHPDVVYPLGGC
jgi:nucleoside-diphosphate-sugar epimerase